MILYSLLLSLFIILLSMTFTVIGGFNMVSDLGADMSLAGYGFSFYCIGNALSVPLGKPFMTRLSPVQLYVVCMMLFACFSLGCACSTNYVEFILFRLLMGLASGPLFLLITLHFIPTVSGGNSRFTANMILICFVMAPLIGASIDGVFSFLYDWRWLFYVISLTCLILSLYLGVALSTGVESTRPEHIRMDTLGYCFYFVGILFISTGLVTGQEFDWFRSIWLTRLLVVGCIALICFIVRNHVLDCGIIDFKLFKNPYFCVSICFVAFLFSTYFGSIAILASWLYVDVNYTPDWIALLIFIMAMCMGIRMFVTFQTFDPRVPIAVAVISFATCCFYIAHFNWDINFGRIVISRVLIGLVIPFSLPALTQLMKYKLDESKLVECQGVFQMTRTIACGLGVGMYPILWQRRQVFYHDRLGGSLTPLSELTRDFIENAQRFNLSAGEALAQLNDFLNKQAASLALNDCFYLMGWIMMSLLIILMVTFLFKPRIRLD